MLTALGGARARDPDKLHATYGALNQTGYRIPYVTARQPFPGPVLPPARYDASFTYDPALGGLVLFGGVGAGGQVLSDTCGSSDTGTGARSTWPAPRPNGPERRWPIRP